MGKVNVVLEDGRVVSVDQADADAGTNQTEGYGAGADRATEALKHEQTSGVGNTLLAGAEGFADAATLGVAGKAERFFGGQDTTRNYEDRADEHSLARGVGELAAYALPTGVLGETGKAAGELTAIGQSAELGHAIGGAGGRLAEGAIQGLGGYVSQTNTTGDPLTIEGAVEGVGVGAFLNYGMGALGDKLQVAGRGAKAKIAADAAETATAEATVKQFKALADPPPSWGEFQEAHKSAQSALKKDNATILRETQEYADATEPDSLNKHLKTFEKTRDEVLSRLQQTQYGQAATAARDEANEAAKAYTGAQRQYAKFVESSTRYPKTLNGFSDAIDEIADRYGVGAEGETKKAVSTDIQTRFVNSVQDAAAGAEKLGDGNKAFISSIYDRMPEEFKTQGPDQFKRVLWEMQKKGKLNLARLDLTGATTDELRAASETAHPEDPSVVAHFVEHDPNGMTPVVDSAESPVAKQIKEYRDQLSKASKLRAGGYETSGGRWTPGPQSADLDASMEELHDLRNKLSKYTHVKVPDLPEIPVAPEGFKLPPKLGDVSDAKALSEAAVDLDRSIKQAREQLRGKDGASALATLRAAEGRVGGRPGFGDLSFPELPPPPRPVVPFEEVGVPKTLREFARMTPEKVARIAKAVEGDASSSAAFEKLMGDLGQSVEPTGMGDTVVGAHKALGGYMKAIEDLQNKGDAAAVKSGSGNLLDAMRKWTKRGAQFSAARAADTGGWRGAFMRTVVGSATGRALDGIEAAYVGGSLLQSKLGVQDKIRGLIAKVGEPMGKAATKLGPVTAYLGAGLIDGKKDPERDPRKQAVNRISEALNAKYSAPDTLYSALEPLMGHPGDVAFKIHQHIMNALGFLAASIPKDPGLDIMPNGSKWSPSHAQTVEFAHRIEAVTNPMGAIQRTLAGKGHPAATETLWTVWPALMQEMAQEVSMMAHQMKITYEQGSGLSALYRTPVTGLQQQPVVMAIQGLYLPQPTQPGTPSGKPTGGAPGRPAAVRSPVAGSSVSALTQ